MTPFPKPCGRLDWHGTHTWTRGPHSDSFGIPVPERDYTCAGRILVEGGYWADWDAEDDAREDQQRDDRIEDELLGQP